MSDSPEARQLDASQNTTLSTAGSAQQSTSEIPSTSSSSAAAVAPSGPTPQSGSHALRIASNPNLPGPPPMFVKQPMQQLADTSGTSSNVGSSSAQGQGSGSHAGGSRVGGNMQQPQHHPSDRDGPKGGGRQAKMPGRKQSNRPPRLQHDDPFLAYDVVVA